MTRPPALLRTEIERHDALVDVRVAGRLDTHSVGELREVLHQLLDEGAAHIQIDLSDAELGDATALGVLIGTHHRARRAGRTVSVSPGSERFARLLRLARLDRVLVRPAPAAQGVAPLTA